METRELAACARELRRLRETIHPAAWRMVAARRDPRPLLGALQRQGAEFDAALGRVLTDLERALHRRRAEVRANIGAKRCGNAT